jgi:hypothetical protein
MDRKVYTREIAEALDIQGAPLTLESVLEREQAIEKRWLEQFKEYQDECERIAERRGAYDKAMAEIADAFISVLHNKNVVVPSLYGVVSGNSTILPRPDEQSKVELINLAIVYATMGRDFEIIMQAVKDNPTLMSEWERFMMALRLAGD